MDRQEKDGLEKRHPIADVAARFTHLRPRGAHLVGRCPFHDDHDPSFTVDNATGTWRCWSQCAVGGDVIDLVGYSMYRGAWNSRDVSMFKEALARLEGNALPPVRQSIPAEWRERKRVGKPIELGLTAQLVLHAAARLYHTTLLAMGRDPGTPYAYLAGRGFSDETIRDELVGYAAGDRLGPALVAGGLSRQAAIETHLLVAGREFLAGRIIFVERDRKGRVLHMIGRKFAPWLNDSARKYLNLKEIAKPLHGWGRLDRRRSDVPVLLVESPPDRLTAVQWGYHALAVIGTGLKEDQAVMLSRLQRPKVIVPHNDGGTGLQAARLWVDRIGEGAIVLLPEDIKDLNELGARPDGEAVFRDVLRKGGWHFQADPDAKPDVFAEKVPVATKDTRPHRGTLGAVTG